MEDLINARKIIDEKLADFILFKLFGWEILLVILNLPKKCIIIVAPHTHWLDFFIAI